MTDILLIQPPISVTNHLANSGGDEYHVGLSYLSGMLKKENISFRTINNSNATYSTENILNLCESEKVKILGISAITPAIRTTVKLAKEVKERFKDKIHILLGNAHISVDHGIINRYPYFDSAIAGEADNIIVEHINKILQGEKPIGIFIATPPMNLDKLPFPAFESIENTIFKKGNLIPIIGTRGCPYKCGYCARAAMSKIVRSRSSQNIVEEMLTRISLTKRFFFNDDVATINKNHIISLCNLIIERKLKIRFEMITRIDLLDDKMVQLLKKAGCISLLVGIESGNERIRNEVIQKNLSDEKIFRGMAVSKKYNLPIQLFFMIGHPEETVSEIMDSINYPLKLEKMGFNNIELVGYHVTIPFPGTRYFDWCLQQGKISPTTIDDYIQDKLGDGFYGHWPYLIPEGLTFEDMDRFRGMGAKKFHLRPAYIFRRLLQDIRRPKQILFDLKNAFYIIKQGTSVDISKIET